MAADISQRIRNSYHTFSKGQKKLANAILNDYDKVAYMTAARLAKLVSVSESTVVRFAKELGFEGYAKFQYAVQELVRTKLTPNQRRMFGCYLYDFDKGKPSTQVHMIIPSNASI